MQVLAKVVLAAGVIVAVASAGSAVIPETTTTVMPSDPFNNSSDLGGHLQGVNRLFESQGLALNLSHSFEAYHAGYKEQTQRSARGLSDLVLQWAPRNVLGRVSVQARYSAFTHNAVGETQSLQGVSNLAADQFSRWRELFVEAPIGSRLRLKAGKVDANTEFAVIQHAADFLNPSAGVSPALFGMPSYPDGAPGVNAVVSPTRNTELGAGIYRTAGRNRYAVAEARATIESKHTIRFAAGVWNTTMTTEFVSMSAPRTTSGAYIIYEQRLWSSDATSGGLRIFARLAEADETLAGVDADAALGVTWTGLRLGNDKDSVGFAVFTSDPGIDSCCNHAERIWEVYYRRPLSRYASLTADWQSVQHPYGNVGRGGGMVAAVRLTFNVSSISKRE